MGAAQTAVLLAVLFTVLTTSHQTAPELNDQCTQQTCTKTCFPAIWERDLCIFYSELAEWVSTAQRCGVMVEPTPQWNRTLTATQQWEQARGSWRAMVEEWKRQAARTGVTGPDSSIIDDFMASGSGSGSGNNDMGVDQSQPSQTAWVLDMQAWGRDYATWKMHERSLNNPTPPFPQSSGDQIIQMFLPQETGTAVRSNSVEWSKLIGDWRNITDAYGRTYEDMCPKVQEQQ